MQAILIKLSVHYEKQKTSKQASKQTNKTLSFSSGGGVEAIFNWLGLYLLT